ncbi:MAG: hypothetical protein F6J87_12880 [Spirulina sp. SIO3F2]|nr:hypothetical protein [Spirulina sp. SIO3F2]
MSDIQKIILKDDGDEYELYIESGALAEVETDDGVSYRDVSLPTVDLEKVQRTIHGYAKYAIGAFVNFSLAEIEEMNLEFNLKIAGEAGIPVLAKSSAEGTFKIQVKCKFPSTKQAER